MILKCIVVIGHTEEIVTTLSFYNNNIRDTN